MGCPTADTAPAAAGAAAAQRGGGDDNRLCGGGAPTRPRIQLPRLDQLSSFFFSTIPNPSADARPRLPRVSPCAPV